MNNARFKFRVWDDTHKEYLPLSDCKLDARSGKLVKQSLFQENRYIIEQCTGLTDRHNKLIYENDVVMCEIPGAFRSVEAVVKWSAPGDNRVEWQCKYLNHFEPNRTSKVISGYTGQELWGKKCTVIGNIHDDQFRDATKMVEDKDNGTNESKP